MGSSFFLIIKSKVKECIQENGLECSSNVFNPLNDKIQTLLTESIERAKQNSRKRLLARDI